MSTQKVTTGTRFRAKERLENPFGIVFLPDQIYEVEIMNDQVMISTELPDMYVFLEPHLHILEPAEEKFTGFPTMPTENFHELISELKLGTTMRPELRIIDDMEDINISEEVQSVKEILTERGSRYGSFDSHSQYAQQLKEIMKSSDNWCDNTLNDSQKEALEMIAHKISRILNGDPYYADSWIDIAGYAQLIVDQLEG